MILTRRYMERVLLKLEDDRVITVTVAQVERGKVRLGFEAAPGIVILREELLPPTPPPAPARERGPA